MSFIVIIPAHYGSTRLPGKPLIDINGLPMVIHVLNKAFKSNADRVIVATDHEKVAHTVEKAGGEIYLSYNNHRSGTERLAEVVEKYDFDHQTIIVNVQVDEPFIPSEFINQVANNLIEKQIEMSTIAVPIYNEKDLLNPNIVKVVIDAKGYALYFSRTMIPWDYTNLVITSGDIRNVFMRHLGIYSYRVEFIRRYSNWKSSLLEQIEMLEQLRVLWYGEKIYVSFIQKAIGISVNTLEDITEISVNHISS